MSEQHTTSHSARRTETTFLRFWRALAASCSTAGADEPTLGFARRAWAAHVGSSVAA